MSFSGIILFWVIVLVIMIFVLCTLIRCNEIRDDICDIEEKFLDIDREMSEMKTFLHVHKFQPPPQRKPPESLD